MIKMYKAYCRATWNPSLKVTKKLGEVLEKTSDFLKDAVEVMRLAGVIFTETYKMLEDKDVEEVIEHNMRIFRIRSKEDFASWTEDSKKYQIPQERVQEILAASPLFN